MISKSCCVKPPPPTKLEVVWKLLCRPPTPIKQFAEAMLYSGRLPSRLTLRSLTSYLNHLGPAPGSNFCDSGNFHIGMWPSCLVVKKRRQLCIKTCYRLIENNDISRLEHFHRKSILRNMQIAIQ